MFFEKRFKKIEQTLNEYLSIMGRLNEKDLENTYTLQQKKLGKMLIDLFSMIAIQASEAIRIVKRKEKFDVISKWKTADKDWQLLQTLDNEAEALEFINRNKNTSKYVPEKHGCKEEDLEVIMQFVKKNFYTGKE